MVKQNKLNSLTQDEMRQTRAAMQIARRSTMRRMATSALPRSVSSIVLSMALPFDYPPVRVPYSGTVPTVIAQPFDRSDWDFTGTSIGAGECPVPNGTGFTLASRDPLHATINMIKKPAAWSYDLYFNTDAGAVSKLSLAARGAGGPWTDENLPIAYAIPTTGFAAPQTILYSNIESGMHCVWINAEPSHPTNFGVTRSISNFGANDLLQAYLWSNGEWTNLAPVVGTGASPTISVSLTAFGYYAFTMNINTAYVIAETASATFNGTADFFTIEPIPALVGLAGIVTGVRVVSAAILCSERSVTLYEGGSIAAVQLANGTPWNLSLDFQKMLDLPGCQSFNTKQGIYAFHKATDLDNFAMVAPFRVGIQKGTPPSVFGGPISPPGGWLLVGATSPIIDGVYPGAKLMVTSSWSIEYTSQNNAVSPGTSACSTADFQAAMDTLRYMPSIHENPLHLSDIRGFLAKGARFAVKMAPKLLSAMGAMNPEFAPLAAALAAFV